MLQVESVSEGEWQTVERHDEENPLVTEAYNDPHLQPTVVMHRLTQSQYVAYCMLYLLSQINADDDDDA